MIDVILSAAGLLITSPVLLAVGTAIVLYDRGSPFYVSGRVGRFGRVFPMIKFRSMMVNADKTGVTSTSSVDRRITPVGHFVRRFKLDELIQLWNVLMGDMSLVGPRPNVPSGVAVYTSVERRLLDVRPGITDFSSIVFADEGEILSNHEDADRAYDQLIRPWKSRLGLFYVDNRGNWLDFRIILTTLLAVVARNQALTRTHSLLLRYGAATELARIALRREPLAPARPPGAE